MGLRLLLVLAAAMLLAGCGSPPVPAGQATAPAPTGFELVDTGAPCPSFCEPSVAVAPDGTLYVLSGYDLRFSHDGGRTFSKATFPPTANGAPPRVFANDAIVQVAPNGVLYISALLTSGFQVGVTTEGLEVARSTDGGQTWESNVYLGLADDRGAIGADRQWLAMDGKGTVCLAYQRYGPVVIFDSELGLPRVGLRSPAVDSDNPVTCSTDGGTTFGAFHSALGGPISKLNGSLIGGHPVLTEGGLLCIPHHRSDSGVLEVACSTDLGATFRFGKVAAGGNWFPMLGQAPDGGLAVAWISVKGELLVSRSDDGGATWSEPRALGDATHAVAPSPWIEGAAGGWHVAWFEQASDAANDLWTASSGTNWTALAAARGLSNGGFRSAGTDYACLGLLPDGRMVVVYADLANKTTMLAIQR
jgi:hypothetical protein